jgi:CubicO group peptidase (beta-lactamase class C family)
MVGYASMRALAAWYQSVLESRDGRVLPGFPRPETTRTWTTGQRAPAHDGVLNRDCAFGFGFMTALSNHGFGTSPSDSAFGHAGFLGNSFAFADPEHGLVVAFMTNGLAADRKINAEHRRPVRIDGIYRALGLV